MHKQIFISLALCTLLVGGAVWLVSARSSNPPTIPSAGSAVTIVDGTQFIDLTAKGGYSPRSIVAKAGVPTVLRMTTNGTFDCSASLVIPKLSYQKFLQSSGIEEIPLSADQARGTLRGTCLMGMYGFQIKFQ